MPLNLHRPPSGLAPIAIGMAGECREAVTAAIALASGGYPVTLHVASMAWLEALADGELPFDAPHLLEPLHAALRAERLDLVPQAPNAAEEGSIVILTRRPMPSSRSPMPAHSQMPSHGQMIAAQPVS